MVQGSSGCRDPCLFSANQSGPCEIEGSAVARGTEGATSRVPLFGACGSVPPMSCKFIDRSACRNHAQRWREKRRVPLAEEAAALEMIGKQAHSRSSRDFPRRQFHPSLHPDRLEKIHVMGDDQERTIECVQGRLERLECIEVEVIGRFVEDEE